MKLKGMFEPNVVAVVGASTTEGKIGNAVMQNMTTSFTGKVIPVNPHADTVCGEVAYSSLGDIPENVDLAVIIVPAKYVAHILHECADNNINDAIVITAGFKEMGPEGKQLEDNLVAIARERGIRFLGPNCFGVISPAIGLNTTFAQRSATEGSTAFMSQSGAFCTAVLDWAANNGLGFSRFVSLGNKAMLSEIDFMKDFATDNQTNVILAYLEGISDGREFITAASEITRHKPIVVIKSGRTSAGARAVSSHTGTLAGSDRAYQAALDKCGIIRARTAEQMFDYAFVLSNQPLLQADQIAVITNAGGPGVMATDAIGDTELALAEFSTDTMHHLEDILPSAASIYNPVDILGDASTERYRDTLLAALNDSNVDGVIALTAPSAIIKFRDLAQTIIEACSQSEKPITCSFMSDSLDTETKRMLSEAGIPHYFDPARAVQSMSVLRKYSLIRSRPREVASKQQTNIKRARNILNNSRTKDNLVLGVETLPLLNSYGIEIPKGQVVNTANKAREVAAQIGGPVVLKLVSPHLSHKSDVGGVLLDVDPENAEIAFNQMMSQARNYVDSEDILGILVQQQLDGAHEVIIGMNNDPQFGPLLMFGLGGIYVEILKDVSFSLTPVSHKEAQEMVESIQTFPLLSGVRGQQGVDIESIVEAIMRVSQLVEDLPEISELDINPLLAFEDGVVAADVRMTLDVSVKERT